MKELYGEEKVFHWLNYKSQDLNGSGKVHGLTHNALISMPITVTHVNMVPVALTGFANC